MSNIPVPPRMEAVHQRQVRSYLEQTRKNLTSATSAQYVTLATATILGNERVLTAGDGIALTDGGAGSTLTVATDIASLIAGATSTTVASSDTLLIADADDSGNLKKVTAGAVAVCAFASGNTVQHVYATTTTEGSTTTTIPYDDTVPQNTEGAELLTATITPTSASNILVISFDGFFGVSADDVITIALFQDSTAGALAASGNSISTGGHVQTCPLKHIMAAGTTSSTTFKIRYGCANGANTSYALQSSGGAFYGGVNRATLSILEIKA